MFQIIYFTAPWCSKCKVTGPAIKSAAAYHNLVIQEIDCNDPKDEDLIKKHDVMSLPTIVLLRDGVSVFKTDGLKSVESLLLDFEPYLGTV